MKFSRKQWTCLDEDKGVLARTYSFGAGLSNCFAVRVGQGELVMISPPVGLDNADFEALETYGKVVALVAPNGLHHLGLPSFVARYPEATLHAPPKAIKRIGKRQPSLPAFESMKALAARLPAHVQIFAGEHLKTGDVFARVKTDEGTIWYSNDVLTNAPQLPKNPLLSFLFKVTKSGPGFKVNRLVLKYFRPRPGFGAWLKSEMAAHPPIAIVPGHGHGVTGDDVAGRTTRALDAGL